MGQRKNEAGREMRNAGKGMFNSNSVTKERFTDAVIFEHRGETSHGMRHIGTPR